MTDRWEYIVAAYALTWVTLGGYALHLWRRGRRAWRAQVEMGPTPGRE